MINSRKEFNTNLTKKRWIILLIIIIAGVILGGLVSKFAIKPSWNKEYTVVWSNEIGRMQTGIPYGQGEANKFDLYLPADNTEKSYGLDQSDEACAAMFSIMAGVEITQEEIRDGTYLEKVKSISASMWVTEHSAPAVVAYGTQDRIQPYLASLRLKAALEQTGVDFQYFELPHSGHGLQNDDASKL